MSWSARIAHTSTGLAIVFAGPVCRIDMAPDVAAHFARLRAAVAVSVAKPGPSISSTSSDGARSLGAEAFGPPPRLTCSGATATPA